MGAITSTVMSLLKKGDRLLSMKELYGETFLFFTKYLPSIGIKVDLVNLDELNSEKLGENGYESAKQCYLSAGVEIEKKIFEEVGKEFKLGFKL